MVQKNNPWMYTTGILAVVLLASMYMNFSLSSNILGALNGGLTGNVINPTPSQLPLPAPTPTVDMKALEDDDSVLGVSNAPVTIIAFEDYQCPFCGRFHQDTFPLIKSEYIDTGKVRFIFRDFPLSFHENAQKASEAAECAGDQGKYWEYSEALFKNQQSLDSASLKLYAQQLGLDSGQFNSCIDSGKYTSEVQKDFLDGSAAGVSGTPSFFVNGQLIVGAQPYSAFKSVIDLELS